jgi:phosphate transport system protein
MKMPSRFESKLEQLHSNMVKLCSLVENVIGISIEAFVKQDKKMATSIVDADDEISKFVTVVESEALQILLLQNPVASDLRTVSTALRIVTDMERIGKQARDICGIVIHLAAQKYQKQQITIPLMAERAKQMVNGGIKSYIQRDINLAKEVIAMDDEMDKMFAKARGNMIVKIQETPEYADQALYLLMVAKYFEKIGDHAVNIAEWAIFCKTGEKKNVRLI